MQLNGGIQNVEPAFRMLLASDGTVTDMLQVICLERIRARKLAQEVQPTTGRINSLDLGAGELLMTRSVLLQGDHTGTNYVYADSHIAITRLDFGFQHALLTSDAPIGRIWRDNRIEIFKEITSARNQTAGPVAPYFGIDADTAIVVRTCRIFVAGKPAMLITEHFSPALNNLAINDQRVLFTLPVERRPEIAS